MASAAAASPSSPPSAKRPKWSTQDPQDPGNSSAWQPAEEQSKPTSDPNAAASTNVAGNSSSSNSNNHDNNYLALSLEASGGLDSGFSESNYHHQSHQDQYHHHHHGHHVEHQHHGHQHHGHQHHGHQHHGHHHHGHHPGHPGHHHEHQHHDQEHPHVQEIHQHPPSAPELDHNHPDQDRLSDVSGISDMSGTDWKPDSMTGPFAWIQRQMGSGADPRDLLKNMITSDSEIPPDLDNLTLWKIILNILSEPPKRDKLSHVNTIEDVVGLIKSCSKIMVLTGAGVSVSCGIPDFRSRDGVYARLAVDFPDLPDPQAMFDIQYFKKDPRPFFKFAREIYPGQFAPSPCHRFIRALEQHGKLLRNYTQNIDTLEQVAGIERVIQCHGSFATASCMKCKHKVDANYIKQDIFNQRIPFCPACPPAPPELAAKIKELNDTMMTKTDDQEKASRSASPNQSQGEDPADKNADSDKNTADNEEQKQPEVEPLSPSLFTAEGAPGIMKPDIVFFGEGLGDEFHSSVAKDKEEADLLIMIGSSLKVRPVALIPSSVNRSVPQVLINRENLPHLTPDVQLLGNCDAVINQLCHLLGEEWEGAKHEEPLKQVLELEEKPAVEGEADKEAEDKINLATELAKSACEDANQSSGEDKPDPEAKDGPEQPSLENDSSNLSSLAAGWRPEPKVSWSQRLKPGTYLFTPPSKYVFPGAEVYSDSDSDDDSSSDSSSDSGDEQQQHQQQQHQQQPESNSSSSSQNHEQQQQQQQQNDNNEVPSSSQEINADTV